MSTKRLAIRGVAWNWLGQVCSIVIIFFLTPFLVHTLGNEAYGLWAIVMGLTGYYGVADAGLRGTATKYVAQYEALGDHSKTKAVVSTLVACYCVLASIAMVAAVVVAWLFPSLFDTAGESVETLRVVVLITAIAFAIKLIGKPFGAVLTAMTRFDLTNALGVTSQLTQAVLMVTVLYGGGGLLGMAWVTLAVVAANVFVEYYLAARVVGCRLLSPSFFDRSLLKELTLFSSGLFVVNGARRTREHSGVIIVGVLSGPAAAAFFAIGNSLVRKSGSLLTGIISVILPVASRLNAQKRAGELARVVFLVPRVLVALSATVAVVLVVFGQSFIDFWIAEGYSANVYQLLCLLAFALVVRQVAGGLPSILVAQGRVRAIATISSLETSLTIALGVYLVYTFGLIGMGLAILVTQIVRAGVLSAYTCHSMGLGWPRFLLRTVLPGLVSNVPVSVAAMAVRRFLVPASLWIVVVEMAVLGLLGAVVALFICLPASTRVAVFRALGWTRRDSSTTPAQGMRSNVEPTSSTSEVGGLPGS